MILITQTYKKRILKKFKNELYHSDGKKTPNATLFHSTHLHSPSYPTLMGKKHLTPLYPTPPTYTVHQISLSLSLFTSSPPTSRFDYQCFSSPEPHYLSLILSLKKYLSETKSLRIMLPYNSRISQGQFFINSKTTPRQLQYL